MSLPLSREVQSVLRRAREIAGSSHQAVSTAHVLVAMFEVSNQAEKLLRDRSITVDRVRQEMTGLNREGSHLLERVRDRSQRLASGSRSEAVTSLHMLAALVRESSSHAYQLLESCGVDIGAIRTAVMSYATSSRPMRRHRTRSLLGVSRKRQGDDTSTGVDGHDQKAPSPIGFHPSLGVRGGERRQQTTAEVSADEPSAEDDDSASKDQRSEEPTARKNRSARAQGVIENLRETGGGLALDNHPGINRGGKPRRSQRVQSRKGDRDQSVDELPQPDRSTPVDTDTTTTADDIKRQRRDRRHQEALEEARKTTRDLAQRLFSEQENAVDSAGLPVDEQVPSGLGVEESHGTVVDEELAAEYTLDDEVYPYLAEYGRNLTREASLGQIDPVIGRGDEISRLIDILGKRRANNPLLVGEPGVGKTAIVEGLAGRLVEMARQGRAVGKRTIIELEMGRLLSGTHLRGAFSERLLGIKDEVAHAEGDVIVFLDEIHMWMSAGTSGDGGDAPGELKTALARGRFPCIGATTHDECRKFVESDPAFERRFQRVSVEEPDEDTALRVIEGVRTHYERHHGVQYTLGALSAAVTLAVRYIHDRQLPDKAIGVIDLAGSRAARQGEPTVDRDAIARVVAESAAIPVERLTGSDGARFLEMESFLSDGIVGHDEIVVTIAELLRRNVAGFRSHRPIGSLLFLGPTGVGKTEMVKVLADFLFHDRDAIVRLDMSEFMEAHSVSRFIGAPPGYVGYDQGGQLTESIRQRPYQVVLLDEIEKAHPDVLNTLLQLFDEGRLTDGRGRKVDFSNTLVVMTSNLGSQVFDEEATRESSPIGFGAGSAGQRRDSDDHRLQRRVLEAAQDHFTPELWNRIDERLVFLPLSRDEISRIAGLQLAQSQQRLREESTIDMVYEPEVIDFLIDNGGYDPGFGARPMRQTIQRLVEGEVAREILAGRVEDGATIVVGVCDGEIVVDNQDV